MTASALRVVSLYPDLLGTYGDNGNVEVLLRRLVWRSLPCEVVEVRAGHTVPVTGDLYVLGGGEDDAQVAASEQLINSALPDVAERGTPVFAVCAGLQLLGESFRTATGRQVAGLGLLDVRTDRLATRALGETVVVPGPDLGLGPLSGFSNHGGSTLLGSHARPLGTVRSGPGNAGAADRHEGVQQGSVLGTYLHGPVLARNPGLADLLLARATGHSLPPLAVGPEAQLLHERLSASRDRRSRWRGRLAPSRR